MRQQEFNWERLNLRRLLESLRLPSVPGVDGETARAVLLAIYDQDAGRPCWPGTERLATRARVCERQIRRVLNVLEHRFGLLARFRAKPLDAASKKTFTHYVIVWSEVVVVLRRGEATPCPVDQISCPVDPAPCPVDQISCPVDQISCPVDPQTHYISAREKEEEVGKGTITTTSTCRKELPLGFETRPASDSAPLTRTEGEGSEGWAAVAEELQLQGIYVRDRLVRQWQDAGRDASEVLSEIRECIRVVSAPVNQDRLRHPKAALVARLRFGDWPADLIQDVDGAARRDQAKLDRTQESRWKSAVHSAWVQVRKATPAGQYVDEDAVVRVAVELGVPWEVAAKERGLVCQ